MVSRYGETYTVNLVEKLFLFMAGIASGAILLLIFKMLRDYRQVPSARLFTLVMIGSACYAINPFLSGPDWLIMGMSIASSAVPGLFWLFTVSFFASKQEGEGIRSLHVLVFAVNMAIAVTICAQPDKKEQLSAIYLLDFLFSSTLVALALWEVVKNWRVDLVECRRRMRASMLIVAGLFLFFALYNQLIYSSHNLPIHIAYINAVSISLMALFIGYWVLVVDDNSLLEAINELPEELSQVVEFSEEGLTATDKQWLDKLDTCMQQEAYYRNNDLTIRSLSEHLLIPEHHLRRLINRQLGYRNFNEYLNRFRITDATARLSDPNLSRLPITTIAIESGFASLTTFNKAFKALKEMTPSEFRRSNTGFGESGLLDR